MWLSHQPSCRVIDRRTSNIVCRRCEPADTFLSRLVGLLGRRQLAAGEGMLIVPSSGIHTFGMRFAIDVVWFDHDLRIVGLHARLPSWRIAGISQKTHGVLELPAGQIEQVGAALGDHLLVQPIH